jgi:hypothetical protein
VFDAYKSELDQLLSEYYKEFFQPLDNIFNEHAEIVRELGDLVDCIQSVHASNSLGASRRHAGRVVIPYCKDNSSALRNLIGRSNHIYATMMEKLEDGTFDSAVQRVESVGDSAIREADEKCAAFKERYRYSLDFSEQMADLICQNEKSNILVLKGHVIDLTRDIQTRREEAVTAINTCRTSILLARDQCRVCEFLILREYQRSAYSIVVSIEDLLTR